MTGPPTILLVGATGAFGERLAEGLVASGIGVIGIARNKGRLDALKCRLGSTFMAQPMERAAVDAAWLGDLRTRFPSLFALVDASGPFQSADYRLPRTAIATGLHYVDLADARGFVRHIASLDEQARAADVAVLAGASSTPALSHAVLDELLSDAHVVTSIDVSILPGNRAPRGLSVVQAILATVGQPIRVFRGGRWVEETGWGLHRVIDCPGLGRRAAALCETPDLDLLVDRYRPTAEAVFRAGLELGFLHNSIRLAAALVRNRVLKSLAPLARPLRFLADLFRPFGTDRGGMQVEALIKDASGLWWRRSWTLIAEAGDGPYLPTLPALAVLKMLAEGALSWRGAGPCVGVVPYTRIANEFTRHRIKTEIRESAVYPPLLRRLLGGTFDTLPAVVRAAHDVNGVRVLEGVADVTGSDNVLGGLIASIFRLPRAGSNLPVRVEMRSENDGSESWNRHYPNRTMRSTLRGPDPAVQQLDEVFGPLAVRLQWMASHDGLSLTSIGARFLGIALPRVLVPQSRAFESVGQDGRGRLNCR